MLAESYIAAALLCALFGWGLLKLLGKAPREEELDYRTIYRRNINLLIGQIAYDDSPFTNTTMLNALHVSIEKYRSLD